MCGAWTKDWILENSIAWADCISSGSIIQLKFFFSFEMVVKFYKNATNNFKTFSFSVHLYDVLVHFFSVLKWEKRVLFSLLNFFLHFFLLLLLLFLFCFLFFSQYLRYYIEVFDWTNDETFKSWPEKWSKLWKTIVNTEMKSATMQKPTQLTSWYNSIPLHCYFCCCCYSFIVACFVSSV